MKSKINTVITIFTISLFLSCKTDDNNNGGVNPPTAAEFNALRIDALDGITQNFVVNADAGFQQFTSAKGVVLSINGTCLTQNGNDITGNVIIEYVEIFDKGTMLATNKPTMGLMPDGNKSMLISGGAFYVNATKNGQPVDIDCTMQLLVPASLTTGTPDDEMQLFNGAIDENGNLVWEEDNGEGQGGVFGEGVSYYVNFGNFGWTNVDKFYLDPRPKTTLLVTVPTGFDADNSAVYLSYDGEGTNALAQLDVYNEDTQQFSEHYGQIPIGLACHVIFVSEQNGMFRYAVQGVNIAEDHVISITSVQTVLGSEAQLVAAINAIQ
ncbi:hypothetical protein GV828_06800 [Flavobacterium sp. NST-5]|uniref:Uncharacterized protein n=1 Tax=Flavobacterium ichthyis TaxID=2698827 RepID=A0ABW9Z866_9FLAO|nr:hypothetical protein [Flavobacterium ichthyis]NBL64906.1 hypothetical protein [Flavobacterium ichthyis]